MLLANNLRKGVLLLSSVLVALLLWLSVSFLLVANSERRDARNLSHFMETDVLLRNAAIALAEERSASYWLTGIDGLFFAAESLVKPRATTDVSIARAIAQLRQIIANSDFSSHLRFQPSHLTKLVVRFESQIKSIENKRAALAEDLKNPSSRRDKSLQIDVLDYYRELIESVELLRHGTTYITSERSRGMQNVFAISDAAWNIGLSNQLLTALFEGYITGGNTAQGDAHPQATALHSNIEESLTTIRRIDAYASIDNELHTLAIDLTDWYGDNYHKLVLTLSMALANNTPSPYTNYDWKKTASTLDEHIQKILSRADELSRLTVASAESRAVRNLTIDGFLVILCILLMGCAS